MHLLLTDRMVCPRCGPAFGLILRTDLLSERRVLEGELGCPNCREAYPVRAGAADLRPPPRGEVPLESLPAPDPERVGLVQALLGVTEGPGELALVGQAARFAAELASLTPSVEWLALHPAARAWEEMSGVSRITVGAQLPFGDRTLRGVLLEGEASRVHLREAARVLAPGHRVVVLDAPAGTPGVLMASGLTQRVDQDGVVVADR